MLTVLAYRDDDTMPSLVTRSDKHGNFAFHYIPAGSYTIVALDDKNRDMRIDSTEAVAWDTLRYTATDSVDSTQMAQLRLSAPDRRKQRLLKAEFTARGRIVVSTLLPMQHPRIEGEEVEWRLGTKGDTLNIWCLNELCDSTVIILTDESLSDTLRLRYRAPARRSRAQSAAATQEPLMKALCTGTAAYYDDLRLAFIAPVHRLADTPSAEVMYLKDSTVSHYPIVLDSSGLQARIVASLHSGEQYRVRLADSLFVDLYGHPTDSLLFSLTPKDYGILTLHVDNQTGHRLIIEVLDSKDTVVARRLTLDAQHPTFSFSHLPAAEYRLRAVIDRNADGLWTPGDYLLRRQPEESLMYGKVLQLREKWELEERWTVSLTEE